jgi:hypothetical protein
LVGAFEVRRAAARGHSGMNPITLFAIFAWTLAGLGLGAALNPFLAAPFVDAAVVIALSLKMANAWEKFVVLRAGTLQSVKAPGLFVIIPVIDTVLAGQATSSQIGTFKTAA